MRDFSDFSDFSYTTSLPGAEQRSADIYAALADHPRNAETPQDRSPNPVSFAHFDALAPPVIPPLKPRKTCRRWGRIRYTS
jgi:hypothetical protein